MEQDQLLRRNQPLSTGEPADVALLIAAHGEKQPGAGNEGVQRIARLLAARAIVPEVAVGFINGAPGIAEALRTLTARRVLVYPLFAANGYFTRDRLVQLIEEASTPERSVEMLPPLGLDAGLPGLIVDRVNETAHENGLAGANCAIVLLAHGSRRNPASREATEAVAQAIAGRGVFREVRTAFLEEAPPLEEAVREASDPVVVMGMFSGEGLHGARDAPHLIARLGRGDVFYAGVIGSSPGIEEVVARSVFEALAGNG